jgi:threonine dehydratase
MRQRCDSQGLPVMNAPTLADIEAAREKITGKVVRTPTVLSDSLSEIAGVPVYLKLEHRQTTGSFKLRGASNAIASLSAEEKRRGVVAASTGNHGRALAYAAKLEGIRAVICMSRLVPENKVSEIRRLGADVKIVGKSQDDAQQEVEHLAEHHGLLMLPPFDYKQIIAGQGTIGLEMLEDVPDTATVAVPVSGGGLAAGTATAVKSLKPSIKVIGVSMARGAAMKASIDAGRPVLVDELPTLADSLGGGIGLDNKLTFNICRDLLDDIVLLSEDEIAAGISHAYEKEREIVEGAGAVGIGALLAGKLEADGPLVLLLSGRNIDMGLHRRVISGERGIFEDAA